MNPMLLYSVCIVLCGLSIPKCYRGCNSSFIMPTHTCRYVMRLNVKTSDTGTERLDWDHIDNVSDVDIQHGNLRYHLDDQHGGGNYDMDTIEYFHVTTVEGGED